MAVKLTTIYTRGGDKGTTSLVGGTRVPKHHARLEAIGGIDESNAAIGLARQHTRGMEDAMLERIQHDLFDLGADVATPLQHKGEALRITAEQVARLEKEIDSMNAELQPLNSFVLPGGSMAAASLHMARSITRRAERNLVSLAELESVNPEALCYLNRLSDHLFVLSRRMNRNGEDDVLWKPGVNR